MAGVIMGLGGSSLQLSYVGGFAAVSLLCALALLRCRGLPTPDVRRGVGALLVLSGLWSAVAAVGVWVGAPPLTDALYLCGQIADFGTVLAWLYFASAYTGRRVHRAGVFRALAVAAYLAVVVVILANPLHGRYLSTVPRAVPFLHRALQPEPLYWLVTGLSYAGTAAGFYLLFDSLAAVGYRSYRLFGLATVAVLPLLADLLLLWRPMVGWLPTLEFGSVGVAAFSVAVLVLVGEEDLRSRMATQRARLTARQMLVEDLADPALVLDGGGRVFDCNEAARAVFDGLDADRPRVSAIAPSLVRALVTDATTIDLGGQTFLLDRREVPLGTDRAATVVTLSDVTAYERQRRELDRQNAQLDDIATAVAHNLRNASNLLLGYIDAAADTRGGTATGSADGSGSESSLAVARRTAERVAAIAEDLHLLARHGKTVESTEPVDPADAAREAWAGLGAEGTALICESGPPVEAEPSRLVRLFEALLEFHLENGASTVTVERPVAGEGFAVSGDGDPLDLEQATALLAFDSESRVDVTGVGLAVAQALARAHGWSLDPDPSADAPRFRVRVVGGQE